MPIKMLPGHDPLSDASLAQTGAKEEEFTANERLLFSELTAYCRGEISGRSFLISGHRGAGKTTLVQRAFLKVLRDSRNAAGSNSGPQLLRPLLVSVHGPSLFSEDMAKKPEKRVPPQASAQTPASVGAGPKVTAVTTNDSEPTCQALVALVKIIETLHRSVVREFAACLRRQLILQASGSQGLPDFELAAEFEAEVAAYPATSRLRELYRRADMLGSGVLWDSGLSPSHEWDGLRIPITRHRRFRRPQGSAELLALSTISAVHTRISGVNKNVEKSAHDAALERKLSTRAQNRQELTKALTAGLAGMLAWIGLAQSDAGMLGSAVGGIIAALGAAFSFSFSSIRSSSKHESREYEFIEDLSLATLDRTLPLLFDRLRRAGLAPVFMIDELDKVKLLKDKMPDIVNHLKKLAAENAMFFFLSDRDYYEHVCRNDIERPYAPEYTYFQHRLFVSLTARDCQLFLRRSIQYESRNLGQPPSAEDIEDELDYPVLLWIIRHRSRLHALELHRQIAISFRNGESIIERGAVRSKPPFKIDLTPRFPFYIGDHPVALHNKRRKLRGTLGLAVPGIEIYFPLTPTLTLALLSPEIGISLMAAGVNGSTPFFCDQSNVIFQNSLQVAQATRFVFCVTEDFELARRMLRDDPWFSRGRKVDLVDPTKSEH